MTFLCIPARLFLLPKFFAGWELCLLDGEEDNILAWEETKEESLRGFKANSDKTREISVGSDDEDGSDDMPTPASVADVSV